MIVYSLSASTKNGVWVNKEALILEKIAQAVYKANKKYATDDSLPVITSGNEWVKGRRLTSKHYEDKALDFRLWYIKGKDRDAFAKEVQDTLDTLKGYNAGDFDVVLEPDHLHVEFDPKTRTGQAVSIVPGKLPDTPNDLSKTRDDFAKIALSVVLTKKVEIMEKGDFTSDFRNQSNRINYAALAKCAYHLADEMLAARGKVVK